MKLRGQEDASGGRGWSWRWGQGGGAGDRQARDLVRDRRQAHPEWHREVVPRLGRGTDAEEPLPQLVFLAPAICNSLKTLRRRCLQSVTIHCSGQQPWRITWRTIEHEGPLNDSSCVLDLPFDPHSTPSYLYLCLMLTETDLSTILAQ